MGKVLIAYMAPEAQRALLGRLPLPRNTSKTITDRAAFERELRRVRARGYAVDDEEFALGVRCVGAPVSGPDGGVVAGIGVLAPAVRMTRSRVPEFAEAVLEAARRLSQRLAGEPEPASRKPRR